jgi:hypothetical protein
MELVSLCIQCNLREILSPIAPLVLCYRQKDTVSTYSALHTKTHATKPVTALIHLFSLYYFSQYLTFPTAVILNTTNSVVHSVLSDIVMWMLQKKCNDFIQGIRTGNTRTEMKLNKTSTTPTTQQTRWLLTLLKINN